MPLRKGSRARSKKGISANIRTLYKKEHRPLKQSIAIAMRLAGKSRPKRKSKGRKRR